MLLGLSCLSLSKIKHLTKNGYQGKVLELLEPSSGTSNYFNNVRNQKLGKMDFSKTAITFLFSELPPESFAT